MIIEMACVASRVLLLNMQVFVPCCRRSCLAAGGAIHVLTSALSVSHALQGRGWRLSTRETHQMPMKEEEAAFSPIQPDHRAISRKSLTTLLNDSPSLSLSNLCIQPPGCELQASQSPSSTRNATDLSSEEDTGDTAYLRRHLPYEVGEQQHSVQVYANDTISSSLDASGQCAWGCQSPALASPPVLASHVAVPALDQSETGA